MPDLKLMEWYDEHFLVWHVFFFVSYRIPFVFTLEKRMATKRYDIDPRKHLFIFWGGISSQPGVNVPPLRSVPIAFSFLRSDHLMYCMIFVKN